jgi:aminopeptidase
VADPRVSKLAQVLVHYSLSLKKGQLVRISGPALAAPLMVEVYREAIGVGANVIMRPSIDGTEEIFFKNGTDEQLRFVAPLQLQEIDTIDADVGIWAHYNTRNLTGVDPKRQAIRREATRDYMKRFFDRAASGALKWVGTQFPTQANAQDAEMSLLEYEDFVFTAGRLHEQDPVAAWRKVRADQQRIIDDLKTRKKLHLVGENIDLTLRVDGRTWLNAAGEHNFPDGEIFTAPLEQETTGWVRFTFPAIYGGREVTQVQLKFDGGRVVEATADKGQDFLLAMLDLDAGARVIGEIAFGTNYSITKFTRNILFDEKIGGTVHMALGSAYPESGGTNVSGLHWDMICDLRDGAEVRADGEVIYRKGQFLV